MDDNVICRQVVIARDEKPIERYLVGMPATELMREWLKDGEWAVGIRTWQILLWTE